MWFKRATLGGAQCLWSGGTNDIYIGFDASDKIVVEKEGTGSNFVSDGPVADTTHGQYLAVVRPAGGPTLVYRNGNSITGIAVNASLMRVRSKKRLPAESFDELLPNF